jgi:hypothetical protein
MNSGVIMLIFTTSVTSAVSLVLLTIFNFDRILVFLLRLADAPFYEEARRVAASIYQHPERWKVSRCILSNPAIGEIWTSSRAFGVHLEGPFGKWEPNFIEIIYDAVVWHRRFLINAALDAPA